MIAVFSRRLYTTVIIFLAIFGLGSILINILALVYSTILDQWFEIGVDAKKTLLSVAEVHAVVAVGAAISSYTLSRTSSRTSSMDYIRLKEQESSNGELPSATQNTIIADPRELLGKYGEDAAKLSDNILRRSGIYLYCGVTIAFIGIILFYVFANTNGIKFDYKDNASLSGISMSYVLAHILQILPGIGTLVFVELVAFFFLRQSRITMDEFRYFDAIKRNREENLILLKMFQENPDRVSTKEVISAMRIYSTPGNLSKDETTDILESRKLVRDEFSVISSFLEAISAFKDIKTPQKTKK